jgi:hypothetical protein
MIRAATLPTEKVKEGESDPEISENKKQRESERELTSQKIRCMLLLMRSTDRCNPRGAMDQAAASVTNE